MGIKKILGISVFCLPLKAMAQDFEDAPSKDNDRYLALIFPKTEKAELTKVEKEINYLVAMQSTLTQYGSQFLGLPYRYGGTTEAGFDCSGYTMALFKQVGIQLPHSSGAQAQLGEDVALDEVRVGDLVFFKGGNRNSNRVGHVAMVYEVNPDGTFKIIHSTNHAGVIIENPMENQYFRPRFLFIKRVLK